MKNNRAVIYCSVWPDDVAFISIEEQLQNLTKYCELNKLKVEDVIIDSGEYEEDQIREGLRHVVEMVGSGMVDHIVFQNISRICRDSDQAFSFLSKDFDHDMVELHVVDWNVRSSDQTFKSCMKMLYDVYNLDAQVMVRNVNFDRDRLRMTRRWHSIHKMTIDCKYTSRLLNAIIDAKDYITLSDDELSAVHGGYDAMQLYNALGYQIKGESTNNTKLVTDVLARNWDKISLYLDQ